MAYRFDGMPIFYFYYKKINKNNVKESISFYIQNKSLDVAVEALIKSRKSVMKCKSNCFNLFVDVFLFLCYNISIKYREEKLNMTYGYCRCSTQESERKQDIDRQKRELKKLGVKENNIFWEYESGTKTDRIQLNRLLDTVKTGDSIATTEVSRLTRSTKQLCSIIEFAKEKRLELIIGTFRVDCRKELDPMTDGMLKMMGVFAEMERSMLSQRVKSGMENAKAKGATIGRPSTTVESLPPSFLKHYPKYTAKQITQEELARLCDMSRQSINKYIKIYKQFHISLSISSNYYHRLRKV